MRRKSIIAIACTVVGAALVGAVVGSAQRHDGGDGPAPTASASRPQAAAATAAATPEAKTTAGRVVGRFAVWGDVRNDPGHTEATPGFLMLVEALARARFSHSVVVGDYIYADGDLDADAARYDAFLAGAAPLTAGRRTHFTIGNHERVDIPGDDALYHEKLWHDAAPGPPGVIAATTGARSP